MELKLYLQQYIWTLLVEGIDNTLKLLLPMFHNHYM